MANTVQEIAEKLNVGKDVAYGLVRFLEKRGHVTRTGSRKEPGSKGKGTSIYSFTKATADGVVADLASFVTESDE